MDNVRTIGVAIEASVKELTTNRDVAVAFSGGLDSGLIAVLAKKYANSLTLYTVGSENSYDVRMSREMFQKIGVEWVHIPITIENIESTLRNMISISGTSSPLTLSFEIPLFMVCNNCKEDFIIGGQGADETFVGYSKYVGLDKNELVEQIEKDVKTLNDHTLEHERKVAEHFNKSVLYPFLDANVLNALKNVDLEDLMPKDQDSRKLLLRKITEDMGHPYIAEKKKKSAQYGSGSMDTIHKLCKSKNVSFTDLVNEIYKEIFE